MTGKTILNDSNPEEMNGGEVEVRSRQWLEKASFRDVQDAADFQTELQQMFNLRRIDADLDRTLLPALNAYIAAAESRLATPEGCFIIALKTLLHQHPAFHKFVAGPVEVYPRPSAVVQADIDDLQPYYVRCLKEELAEALSQEAEAMTKAASNSE